MASRHLTALDVAQLRAFVALIDSGRVTSAAAQLGLAQSTVSEAISALERGLGRKVVVRGRGRDRAQLTSAGDALLPHARAVLAAVDEAVAAVGGTSTKAGDKLDIIAAESVSTYVLPLALTELRRRWPSTTFSVSVAPCPAVREDVASGAFDLGLAIETGNSGHGHVVVDAPLVIFANPSHPLVRRPSFSAVGRGDLADYPLFLTEAAGDFRILIERFFKRDRSGGPPIEASGSVEGLKRAVAASDNATGLLPLYALNEELRRGVFGRIHIQPAPPRMRVKALLSHARAVHPATNDLLEILKRAPASGAVGEPLIRIPASRPRSSGSEQERQPTPARTHSAR